MMRPPRPPRIERVTVQPVDGADHHRVVVVLQVVKLEPAYVCWAINGWLLRSGAVLTADPPPA